MVTRAEIVTPTGTVRAWLPLPLTADTDYFKSLGQTWTGNAKVGRVVREDKYGAGVFFAEWEAGEATPVVEVTVRFATRDRAVDFTRPSDAREDKRVLARYLEPTRLMPTDGIVQKTAREITKGQKSDLDKSRALYEWIVENTFRDPKVRGCGVGDIRAMLESGNLSGSAPTSTRSTWGWRGRWAFPRGTCTACGWPTRPSSRASGKSGRSRGLSTAGRSPI